MAWISAPATVNTSPSDTSSSQGRSPWVSCHTSRSAGLGSTGASSSVASSGASRAWSSWLWVISRPAHSRPPTRSSTVLRSCGASKTTHCVSSPRTHTLLSTSWVSGTTRNVILEAATFQQVTVARSARRHRLPSEAAKRFERGVDPELPLLAARRAAELIAEHGGGQIDAHVTDEGDVNAPAAITFPIADAERVGGVH